MPPYRQPKPVPLACCFASCARACTASKGRPPLKLVFTMHNRQKPMEHPSACSRHWNMHTGSTARCADVSAHITARPKTRFRRSLVTVETNLWNALSSTTSMDLQYPSHSVSLSLQVIVEQQCCSASADCLPWMIPSHQSCSLLGQRCECGPHRYLARRPLRPCTKIHKNITYALEVEGLSVEVPKLELLEVLVLLEGDDSGDGAR